MATEDRVAAAGSPPPASARAAVAGVADRQASARVGVSAAAAARAARAATSRRVGQAALAAAVRELRTRPRTPLL